MNKVKVLSFLVGLLVLLNVTIICYLFLWSAKPDGSEVPQKNSERQEPIRRHFNFSDDQMARFLEDKARHQSKLYDIRARQKRSAVQYYNARLSHNHLLADSLLAVLHKTNDTIYNANADHLQFISELCNDTQKVLMPAFITEHINNEKKLHRRRRK